MPDVVTEQPFQRYRLSSKAWLLEAARKRPRRQSERFGGQKGVGGPAGGLQSELWHAVGWCRCVADEQRCCAGKPV